MTNSAMMITKVKNIYIMLLHAISKENISIVDHFLDDTLTAKINELIEKNKANDLKQLFRQQNISNLVVVEEDEEYQTIQAEIRHITYFVNRKTNKYVCGDNKTRITNTIFLKIRKNNNETKTIIQCPNCGAALKINSSAICSYCGIDIDERFSDYVLCSISY